MTNQHIIFEDRAVAFVDILGFKNIVNSAINSTEQLNLLEDLVNLLDSAVPDLNSSVDDSIPNHLIPRHIYISDCIILSAPLKSNHMSYYCGLSVVVMRVIQLTHRILNAGYLVSGGIAVGQAWHTPSNIVGPAYQEAYAIESGNSLPCVLLSDKATVAWRNCINSDSTMCLPLKSKFFVNGLHEYYIPNNDQHGEIEAAYDNYEAHIEKRLNSNLKCRQKKKWRWMKHLLKQVRV